MKNLTILLLLLVSVPTFSQIRPFDNSKSILPWLYNPTTTFISDFQAYVGYDGRGTSSYTPQSVVAGVRMPLLQQRIRAPKGRGRRSRQKTATAVVSVQILNTTQDIVKSTTINVNYAHQVDISSKLNIAFGMGVGIFNMNYNYNALTFIDQQDPLLNNGESFYNLHLNAGVTFTIDSKLFINLATPYLLKNNETNFNEIILRIGYPFALGDEIILTAAANLDTYNYDFIYGADIRVEWKEMVSLLAGGDNNKYHVGLLFDITTFALGYTYGQNFEPVQGQLQAHQISLYSTLPF
jgi:type IX secretion system membrane protein PorP/SprF